MDVGKLIEEIDVELRKRGAVGEVLCEVGGFKVMGYKLEREGGKKIYLSAGIHGDEPAGSLALLKLIRGGLLEREGSWYLCPVLNPTGLKVGTRENADGVDLNRDYLKFETEEVTAHARWLEGVRADLAISLHEDWESTGFYFYEINQEGDRPERYGRMVETVGRFLPMEREFVIDGHEVREAGWIYHGCDADEPENWPEAIYLAKRGCPLSFTFETPSGVDLDLRVCAHEAAVRATLELCDGQG